MLQRVASASACSFSFSARIIRVALLLKAVYHTRYNSEYWWLETTSLCD